MIRTSIIRVWFLGLFSWILLGLGIYLSHKWYQRAWSYDFNLHRSYFDPHIGNNVDRGDRNLYPRLESARHPLRVDQRGSPTAANKIFLL
jgi:hypothetical protein